MDAMSVAVDTDLGELLVVEAVERFEPDG